MFNFQNWQLKLKQVLPYWLIVLIFIAGQHSTYAQKFERFTNKEGFNQNTITTITQDAYGFLWFGTPNGLIKYDGYDFTTYNSESSEEGSISNNNINNLFTDSAGLLWIGTKEGVDVYVPWLEKFYKVPLPAKLNISQLSNKKTERAKLVTLTVLVAHYSSSYVDKLGVIFTLPFILLLS